MTIATCRTCLTPPLGKAARMANKAAEGEGASCCWAGERPGGFL